MSVDTSEKMNGTKTIKMEASLQERTRRFTILIGGGNHGVSVKLTLICYTNYRWA